MSVINFAKVVSALPGTLVANTVYLVRVGTGFRMYVTNQSGMVVAYAHDALSTGDLADASVSFSKIQDITNNTILGRVSGGTGDVEALTATQVRSLILPSGLWQGGRLALSSAPYTSTDVTGATSVRLEPYGSAIRWIHDGTTWNPYAIAPQAISLSGLSANTLYDVWHYINSGAEVISFVAWTNDTTRASALKWKDGVLVNNASITTTAGHTVSAERAVLLGSIKTTSAGQCEDSLSKRLCANALNRLTKVMYKASGASITYSSATPRAWNNDGTNNSIDWVDSIGQNAIPFCIEGSMTVPATGTAWALLGLAYNTTSIADAFGGFNMSFQGDKTMWLAGSDTMGYRRLYVTQQATGSGTTNFFYYELTSGIWV